MDRLRAPAWVGLVAAALIAWAGQAAADTITVDVASGVHDSGFYHKSGTHYEGSIAYYANYNDYRGYLVFDLSGITGTVTSVTLTLDIGTCGSYSAIPFTVFAVTASRSDVVTIRTSPSDAGKDIYADLGDGTSYGSFTVDGINQANTDVTFTLNDDAITALNAALGGYFIIGLDHTSFLGSYLFLGTDDNSTRRLTLTTSPANPVPEPGTLAFLGLGLTALAVRRWRRRTGD